MSDVTYPRRAFLADSTGQPLRFPSEPSLVDHRRAVPGELHRAALEQKRSGR